MSGPTVKKLAVFDIDGTIFRSSLLIELINGLVEARIFPPRAKKEIERDYLAWVNRSGTYEKYLEQVVSIHLKYLAGCKPNAVRRVAAVVVAFHKDHLYRYTRCLIGRLKKEKFFLLAVSGSPDFMVRMFSKYLGFDAYYAVKDEIKNGQFSGKELNIDAYADKAGAISRFLAARGLKVNLKQSIAVGDTESDIPMLSMVGRPIAFNPNEVLARHAKTHRWQIVVERKDVAFEIKKFSIAKIR